MEKKNKEIYVTIVGVDNYIGIENLRVGDVCHIAKDKQNLYDEEAIQVTDELGARLGFIANSVATVAKGTYSAGRLYDKIEDCGKLEILFVTSDAAIGRII